MCAVLQVLWRGLQQFEHHGWVFAVLNLFTRIHNFAMRRLLIATIILTLILMLNERPIRAQEPPKWPPNPDVLFAEGVEVIEAKETVPLPPQPRQTSCGMLESYTDSDVALIKRGEQFYICELATGALSQPMPIEDSWHYDKVTLAGKVLDTSPDQKWAWYISHQAHVELHLRAYERATGRLIDLGTIPDTGKYFQEFGWASNTELYYTSRDMPEWYPMDAFVATIPIENSLRNVMGNTRFPVFYHDDPPRLEKWEVPSNDDRYIGGMPPVDCTRSVYDFKTQFTTVYHYGNLCIPEYGDANGDGYYRDVQADNTVELVRFNPLTQERKNLHRGQFEHLFWVSADDAYALVMVDDDNTIECRPGFEYLPLPVMCSPNNTELQLIELATGRIMYRLPLAEGIFDSLVLPLPYDIDRSYFNNIGLLGMDQRTLALTLTEHGERLTRNSFLIRIDGQAVTVETLKGIAVADIDARHLILVGATEAATHVIFNVNSHTTTPLTNTLKDYRVVFEHIAGDTAVISVSPSRDYQPQPPIMQYTVKLPMP